MCCCASSGVCARDQPMPIRGRLRLITARAYVRRNASREARRSARARPAVLFVGRLLAARDGPVHAFVLGRTDRTVHAGVMELVRARACVPCVCWPGLQGHALPYRVAALSKFSMDRSPSLQRHFLDNTAWRDQGIFTSLWVDREVRSITSVLC